MLKNERNEVKKIMNENKIIALSKAQSHIGIHTANCFKTIWHFFIIKNPHFKLLQKNYAFCRLF